MSGVNPDGVRERQSLRCNWQLSLNVSLSRSENINAPDSDWCTELCRSDTVAVPISDGGLRARGKMKHVSQPGPNNPGAYTL